MADLREQFLASLARYLESIYGPCDLSPECESPIEAAYYQALSIAASLRGLEIITRTQHKIADYRVDFFIRTSGLKCPKCSAGPFRAEVIVECDGHDFHERTKEQASRDRSRDRMLQQMGYVVFRYTGSDIWKDVFGCAAETIEHMESTLEEQSISHWQENHC